MGDRIRVTVVAKAARENLQLRYRDRLTGHEETRSSETKNRREAERAAVKWEEEIRSKAGTPQDIGWADFIDRYTKQHLDSLAENSEKRALLTLDKFTDLISPLLLSDVTAWHISRFQSLRRDAGTAETTIGTDMRNLRGALQWACDVDLLKVVPKFPRTKRAKTGRRAKVMKGRPITEEEFQTMLKVAPEIVGEENASAWRFYLTGLWLGGLRLTESLELFWDRDDRLSIDFSMEHPVFKIAGEFEKGKTDRYLPMAPQFAEFLEAVPKSERVGRVFKLPRERNRGERISHWHVSEIVSSIGEKAGIVVDRKTGKFASAHDLRRSFGQRWALLVLPQILQSMMRHESIETTLRYYSQIDTQAVTAILWSVYLESKKKRGNKKGNGR